MSVVTLVSPNPLRSRTFPCPHHFRSATSLPTHGVVHHLVSLSLRRGFVFSPSGGLLNRRRHESRASSGGADRDEGREVPSALDAFLSAAEALCVAPPLLFSAGGAVGYFLPKGTPKLFTLGNAFFVGQFFSLVVAVVIGVLIRNRQARGVSGGTGAAPGGDLLGRIEKVEEDVRSSTTVIRGLSRHLEKLGTRFRVTRRTLKDPISETAELAKRNSEATRVLALQAEILEKELMEIQEVLLAMQDQQQKQLDLIVAIGKAGMLNKSDRRVPSRQDAAGKTDPVSEKKELQELDQVQIGKNDKP